MESETWSATEINKEVVTHYFFRAWSAWEQAHEVEDWMARGFAFSDADTCLYQASSLAGLQWPWSYRLPRERRD